MLLAPEDIFENLEFDKILAILQEYCYGQPAKERISRLEIHTQKFILERYLTEVEEYQAAMEKNEIPPVGFYPPLEEEERMLTIEGYVLSELQFANIAVLLRGTNRLFKYFDGLKKESYPYLYDLLREIMYPEELLEKVDKIVDEEGRIKPDASPELLRLNKLQISKRKELDKAFRVIINDFKSKGYLKDTEESFRNGRRVLTVASEHKRKIRGIIHDESTTGKTAYVEPEGVISINNDIFDLHNESKREVLRLLSELSEYLRPYLPNLVQFRSLLTRFDVIQAKAQLSRSINGVKPDLNEGPFFQIKTGYHPLLFLKNRTDGKKTIPFDLEFEEGQRILVLSGPNAGGKSICLKSVGLLQLMLQSGMLVPVDNDSAMGIFDKIFLDMGDHQSLEDELSTYSSRLRNMKYFLENSDEKTLVLIDEFGSGTDPKIGGAIAEAMLKDLNRKKVHGLITTHYSNLKMFANDQDGIVNGSMTFDAQTFSPTYKLEIGKPGSSYAFEIAEKSGLSKRLINYAKKKTGKNEKAIDELLVGLQKEKQALEKQIADMDKKQADLDRLMKAYDRMNRELEVKRKRLKLEKKEQALQSAARTNKELEKILRQIKEEKNEEKAKHLLRQTKKKRAELSETVSELSEDVYKKVRKKSGKQTIEVGDFVKLVSGGDVAKVESIQKNRAVVIVNHLRMTVKLSDLESVDAPITAPKKGKIETDMLKITSKFINKLDLRGMRREEALKTLESFVDEALVANGTELQIIHGKGDGVLRKAVKQKLREYKEVVSVRHEEPEKGGDGITIAMLG